MFHPTPSSSIFPSKYIYKLLCTTSQRLYSARRTDFTVYKIFGIQNNPAAFVQIGFATLTASLDLYFSHMTLPLISSRHIYMYDHIIYLQIPEESLLLFFIRILSQHNFSIFTSIKLFSLYRKYLACKFIIPHFLIILICLFN